MPAQIYKSSIVSGAGYGTPDISGLVVTGMTISESASTTEVKDDQGSVIAVAVSEPKKEISIDGMMTGSFSQTVGSALTIALPGGGSLGGTTIVTSVEKKYAAEKFEEISMKASGYSAVMTASSAP